MHGRSVRLMHDLLLSALYSIKGLDRDHPGVWLGANQSIQGMDLDENTDRGCLFACIAKHHRALKAASYAWLLRWVNCWLVQLQSRRP